MKKVGFTADKAVVSGAPALAPPPAEQKPEKPRRGRKETANEQDSDG